MFRSVLSRGVSAGVLTVIFASSSTYAQQSLPTINVGGARSPVRPTQTTSAPSTATQPSSTGSSRPGEPKTPEERYVVRSATTSGKINVPIRQMPVSVAVVPRQAIVDQNITRAQDAVENVSGVRVISNDVQGQAFIIRGFRAFATYRNFLSFSGPGSPMITDTANVERIEVLKGPSSILYGRTEPGGLVNIITKQPLDYARHVVSQEFGSFAFYRTQWDSSAPIKEVPGLAYRFTGAYQNAGSFLNFQGGRRLIVAPVVRYSPSNRTEITFDAEYLNNAAQVNYGVPVWPFAYGSTPAPIPLSRTFQEPNDPRDSTGQYVLSYNIRQNLNENWKVTNRFLYLHNWYGLQGIQPLSGAANGVTVNRKFDYQADEAHVYSTNIDLEGKLDIIGTHHTFLMGLDYLNRYFEYYKGTSTVPKFPINMFFPIYGTVPSFAYEFGVAGLTNKAHQSTLFRQKGLYIQDHINMFDDRLHVLLGARYDVADVVQGFSRSAGGNTSANQAAANFARLSAVDRIDTGWSPRVGAVFDVTKEVSVYAHYARSFGANNGLNSRQQPFPPQRGMEWEVGLKARLLNDVLATLAFYQLTRSNLTTRDFASPDPTALKLAGLQRSRGIELDVIGTVTERMAIIANYAYTDAKVIADNWRNPLNPYGSGLLYDHLDNVPRHSGKIWLTYDFGENGLGWRVGGGVTAATHAWGDIQNTFVLPGWARLDGFASYTHLIDGHKLTAQLNLRNINNAQYFNSSDGQWNNPPRLALFAAQPFTAVGTVRFEW
ncbi:TonB-dependent siderophore receptor [Methylocystis sp.]|uniref:TonB-dependent siderophore receptor n=1 Tax=Methylocystis sp. TaxID=1911079 RepID=UPI003D14DC8D